jgi:hypothetical protein
MAAGLTEILTAVQQLVQATNSLVQATNGTSTKTPSLVQTWSKSLLNITSATATSATGGTASALPAQPLGYFTMINPNTGNPVKVPFYGN